MLFKTEITFLGGECLGRARVAGKSSRRGGRYLKGRWSGLDYGGDRECRRDAFQSVLESEPSRHAGVDVRSVVKRGIKDESQVWGLNNL